MDLTSSLEAKFGARSGQVHQVRGKLWEVLSDHKMQKLGKAPILGSYLKFRGQNLGYLSFIFLETKFGAPTRISEANFGAKPPDLLIWKYPLGSKISVLKGLKVKIGHLGEKMRVLRKMIV